MRNLRRAPLSCPHPIGYTSLALMKHLVKRHSSTSTLLAALCCALGCGSSSNTSSGPSGSTTVTGTIAGAAVPTTSSFAVVGPLVDTFGPFTSNGIGITISNVPNSCTVAQRHGNPSNTTNLNLLIAAPNPVTSGSYAISTTAPTATSTIADLVYETTDANCHTMSTHTARSGSIVISAVSATTVEGTFSVTMDTGESLSGTFSVPICDVGAASDAGPSACGA